MYYLLRGYGKGKRIKMTDLYTLTDEFIDKGIDWNLLACLRENEQPFAITEVKKVLSVYEGENDEAYWRWIIELDDERFVYLNGWCDYSGWD